MINNMGTKYLLILLLFHQTLCGEIWDYTTQNTMNCNQITEYDEQGFWDAIRHHALDRYFILVLGPIEIVLLTLVLLSYSIKNSKSQPSDIIMALAVCQLLSIGAALFMAVFQQINPASQYPSNFMSFCNTVTIFAVIGWISISIYTILFCIILSSTVRNALNGGLFSKTKYHIISTVLIILGTVGVFYTNNVYDQTAICAVRYSTVSPYLRGFASACLILIALISIYRFKTGIPKNSFFQQQSLYKFYYVYIFVIVSLQILSQILGLTGIYNCFQDSPDPALGISYSIENIIELLNPILLFLLRISHPAVLKRLKQIGKKKKSSLDLVMSLTEEEDINEVQYNWLGSLLESIRGSQVYSILVGMLLSHIDFKNDTIRSIKDVDFHCRYVYEINQFTADRYIDKTFGSKESKRIKNGIGGLKPLDFQVTCYCPRVFKYFLEKSGLSIQLSLSLVSNGQVMREQAHMHGGKAGQFLFSSFDNQIILKTITKQEANLYQTKIGEFVKHYSRQQNSLISPIIGLYKFKRLDMKDESIYIILQKNIAMCEKEYTNRVYDLKGVSFARKSLDRKTAAEFRDVTFLDKQFLESENKIDISPIGAAHIKRILIEDINFLKSLQVIDYSLLIIKINWDRIQEETGKAIDPIIANSSNPFRIVPSETERGVYYHFALIDYLHTWTIGKQTSRFFKRFFRSQGDDQLVGHGIQSDEPAPYGYRLHRLVEKIF